MNDCSGLSCRIESILFTAFDRQFNLNLWPRSGLFSPSFEVYHLGHTENKMIKYDFQVDHLYECSLDGDLASEGSFYIDEYTILGTFEAINETYAIEPYQDGSNRQDGASTFIIYRQRDLKYNSYNNSRYLSDSCNIVVPNSIDRHHIKNEEEFDDHKRYTREIMEMDTCKLALVADYRFFNHIGDKNVGSTINYMVHIADRVDRMYRSESFEDNMPRIGFQISKIIVHNKSYTSAKHHYNMQKSLHDIQSHLKLFSLEDWSQVCLAHLFTYQDFTDGTIGLAYVASQRQDTVGGICSPRIRNGNDYVSANVGLSTPLNWGKRMTTLEFQLVLAHGHSFGSEHDPLEGVCSPSEAKGGKYLMFPAALSGLNSNNKLFSSCSKDSIKGVLQAKSQLCFTERSKSRCGNYEVEEGEECDAGILGNKGRSSCCTPNCKFRPNAVCSDENEICCLNCQIAPNTTLCQEAVSEDISCLGESYCEYPSNITILLYHCYHGIASIILSLTSTTGFSSQCPQALPKEDNAPCIGGGVCQNGICLTFCEKYDKSPCICSEDNISCQICCKDNASAICKPHLDANGQMISLPDDNPCLEGICKKGKCSKTVQDFITRIHSALENLSSRDVAEWITNNIVGATLIISVLVWIPCSCIVNTVDNKQQKNRDKKRMERYLQSVQAEVASKYDI
ncbi:ADAM 17-like protease [Trichoplax sp. H2]|nr:ADAM 17-like protease [Trichoplax sp. H2]|eukprot:RDD42127.1 ADAM 17-like protease [Trichoplax sp. H2]